MVGPPINWRDPDITCRILEIKAFFEEKPASGWAECFHDGVAIRH